MKAKKSAKKIRKPSAKRRMSSETSSQNSMRNMESLLVRACMSKAVDLGNPEMTISEAAQKMRDGDFGILPIGENDRLVGMVTDRDIVIRAVAEGRAPEKAKVREVMTGRVLYCFEDQTIDEVARNMGENQVKRLPVMNREKRLVGMLSLGDIARSRASAQPAREALRLISAPEHREPQQLASA